MEKIPKATHPIPSNTCDFLPISTIRNNLTVDFSFLESLVICDKIATYFIIISTKDFQKTFMVRNIIQNTRWQQRRATAYELMGRPEAFTVNRKWHSISGYSGLSPRRVYKVTKQGGGKGVMGGRPGYSLITQPPSLNNSETEFVCWQIETQIGLMTIGSVIFSYTSLPESEWELFVASLSIAQNMFQLISELRPLCSVS